MELRPEVSAEIEAALAPTEADLVTTRTAVLSALRTGNVVAPDSIVADLVELAGVTANPDHRAEILDVTPRTPPLDLDARNIPQVVRARTWRAVREVFAELSAQGLVTPASDTNELHLGVRDRNTTGGARIVYTTPDPGGSGYRLLRQFIETDGDFLFDDATFTGPPSSLLGPRGRRCLTEALGAHRRGLYLSAANMLGAASEAVWYRLGELLREGDDDLGTALDQERTAQVIRLVSGRLETRARGRRTTITELRVHAGYLRDLRNYGAHPRDDSDQDREVAFTETGSALLAMQSRRYFARLHDVAIAAGLVNGSADQ